MRANLIDSFGNSLTIDTANVSLVADWFQSWLPVMKTQGSRMPWYLSVTPTESNETDQIPQHAITVQQLEKVIKNLRKGQKKLSDAGWCDYRNHAYRRPNDLEDVNVITRKGESKELCDECAAEIGLIDNYKAPESPEARHAAITNGD